MTEEERKEVDDTIARFQEHERQMEALLVKYIGEKQLAFGRSFQDSFMKLQWYGNRIKDLGLEEGYNAARQRRCRTSDSKKFQHYQERENEIRQVTEALILEMVVFAHTLNGKK